jgi:peptidoglycan/LPS O-acetylase OafA/YrhL
MTLRHDPPHAPRLAFLDGLRGLAALYVVLFHAMVEARVGGRSEALAASSAFVLLRYGHYAVAVFIVLSGYCLMRSVAARGPAGRSTIPGGLAAYLGRRARRILPPYYAALGLCLALVALTPALRRPDAGPWRLATPAGEVGAVVSHLLLVHNWAPGWIYKINPPAWTVATEWQIYLVFPLLLAARRRLGAAVTVAVAFAAGWGIAGLGPVVGNLAMVRLCPWYLGLFALGMAAAEDAGPRGGQGPRRRPFAWAVAAAAAVGLPLWLDRPNRDVMTADPVVGAAAAVLIARLARRSAAGRPSRLLGILESRPSRWLGSVSYSLYLTHFPLLALAGAGARGIGLGPDARTAAMLGLAAPVCVLAAWPFARTFERPSHHARQPHAGPGARPSRNPARILS